MIFRLFNLFSVSNTYFKFCLTLFFTFAVLLFTFKCLNKTNLMVPKYIFGFPSEEYMDTCGEIQEHFDLSETQDPYGIWFRGKSELFKSLNIEFGKDGCVCRMTYFLKPGKQGHLHQFLHKKYSLKLEGDNIKDQVLFNRNDMSIKFDLTESTLTLYLTTI